MSVRFVRRYDYTCTYCHAQESVELKARQPTQLPAGWEQVGRGHLCTACSRAAAEREVRKQGERHREIQALSLPVGSHVRSLLVIDFSLVFLFNHLDFSMRTYNRLKEAGLATIRDLCNCTARDLMGGRGFGKKSLAEVEERLAREGLHLAQDECEIVKGESE